MFLDAHSVVAHGGFRLVADRSQVRDQAAPAVARHTNAAGAMRMLLDELHRVGSVV
jgi:hypothetical protein